MAEVSRHTRGARPCPRQKRASHDWLGSWCVLDSLASACQDGSIYFCFKQKLMKRIESYNERRIQRSRKYAGLGDKLQC